MMPGFSLNWRRTSATTASAARPTAVIDRPPNRKGSRPPNSRPTTTKGVEGSKAPRPTPPKNPSAEQEAQQAAEQQAHHDVGVGEVEGPRAQAIEEAAGLGVGREELQVIAVG